MGCDHEVCHEASVTPSLLKAPVWSVAELVAYGAEDTSCTKGLASVRVCDRLRGPLSKLMGLAGFVALLSRALTLAKAEAPCLNGVKVAEDASLTGMDEIETDHPENAAEAEIVLVAHLIGLLVTFIGKGLTVKLTQDVWPDVSVDDLNLEEKTKQ